MAGDGEIGLFGMLPDHPVPAAAAGGGVPRLRAPERRQVALRAVSLDQLVPAEHRVRQVWAFAEGLDLAPLYARIKAVAGAPGHPPAEPRLLVALWLYATVEGVGSARALAKLCREHLAYQWLCGGVGINHKSLGDFRVAHGDLLERLLTDGFAALLRAGIASLERVAQDGMRVRAAAGAASFRRRSTLEGCRQAAAARLAELRAELTSDPAATSRRQAGARARAARQRQERVEQALAAAAALGQQRAARAGKAGTSTDAREPRASTSDPQARVMKMADGGFRPAFNLQLASDTKTGLIAAVALDACGSDQGKLAPMSDRLAERYGQRPAQHLADGGYATLGDIERLERAGSEVLAPPPEPRDPSRERHAALPDDPPEVAAWRQRMGTDAAQAIYRLRAATAECANAQARNRGLVRFTVRGLAKAKAVALWFALAHNMARSWSLATA